MKQNSKKILTWLWVEDPTIVRWVPSSDLPLLLPDLSSSGRRSLLSVLKNKQLIFVESIDGETRLSLTSHGRRAVNELFPALSDEMEEWRGQWSLLMFLQAPRSDPNFRYLRSVLVSLGAQSLTRGGYMYPGNLPGSFVETCERLYKGCVTLFTISRWQFGDERTVAVKAFGLQDVVQSLSGIGKELDQLLEEKNFDKGLSDQDKKHLFLVFDRFMSVLESDMGITRRYFSNVIGSRQLLTRLQSLFSSPN